jgi:hypothetical protein
VKTAAKPAARPTVRTAAKATTKPKPKATPLPKSIAKRIPKSAARAATPVSRTKPPTKAVEKPTPGTNGTHRTASGPATNGTARSLPASAKAAVKPATAKLPPARPPEPVKELAPRTPSQPQAKDRVFLAVNDPYWLHVMWDLSAGSVQRAEAAFKQDWYGAKRIIRLFDVTSMDTTSTSETPIRDITIEGDGRNWYINVQQPPRQYRADIGYISRRGDFVPIARSNVVTPPKAGSSEALDAGWEKDPKKAERILAMSTGFEKDSHPELKELFEDRYGPLGAKKDTGFGTGATPPGKVKKFDFQIDAKLLVHGRTDPDAHLTLGNDPIKLNPDGTFYMQFSLPDSRQIIPAVATSADGVEERTIVLAVERNTKYLDPMIHDQMNEV